MIGLSSQSRRVGKGGIGRLMLAAETLIQLGLPSEHALNKVREVRARHYRSGVSGIREEDKL